MFKGIVFILYVPYQYDYNTLKNANWKQFIVSELFSIAFYFLALLWLFKQICLEMVHFVHLNKYISYCKLKSQLG